MAFVRSIGRWALTGLVINGIIGSGIFGVPRELTRLLGRASPLAMILAALIMAVIMAPIAEVASQFSDPGGAYLYVRTAFGPFAGLQAAWFSLLAPISASAANANLFVIYLAGLLPVFAHGWGRILALTVLIAIPTIANYRGVGRGAELSSLLAIAKLAPLALLIVLGVSRFFTHAEAIHASDITAPGAGAWLSALLLLMFAYGGYENPLVPGGEIKTPRQTVPFALGAGLIVAAVTYTLLQFIIVTTIGTRSVDRPVAEAASVLVGPGGGVFVAILVMLSTYGNISAHILANPRLASSMGEKGEFPAFLGRLHPRFNTPTAAIVLLALLVWILAVTGTFLWALGLTAGSMMILYGSMCAALIPLRRLRPEASALRVPFGPVLAVIGICICAVLVTRLELRQALLMGVTAMIAAANWWFTRRRTVELSASQVAPSDR